MNYFSLILYRYSVEIKYNLFRIYFCKCGLGFNGQPYFNTIYWYNFSSSFKCYLHCILDSYIHIDCQVSSVLFQYFVCSHNNNIFVLIAFKCFLFPIFLIFKFLSSLPSHYFYMKFISPYPGPLTDNVLDLSMNVGENEQMVFYLWS